MYTELTINGQIFKLKLGTRQSIQLEKSLGYNPLKLLFDLDEGKLPKLMDMIIMLQAMLQQYHHGYTVEKTMDLFDDYAAEGNSMFDLVPVFMEVFQQSGYISKEATKEEVDEKN